jgi:5-methylcytosine-specific restriction endonuclease McrA
MPTFPPVACVEQPCPRPAEDRGRCAVHRQSTTERGYGSVHQAEARAARPGARCVVCGSTTNLQRGHRIPTSLGGSQANSNKEWMCGDCHPKFGLRRDSRVKA